MAKCPVCENEIDEAAARAEAEAAAIYDNQSSSSGFDADVDALNTHQQSPLPLAVRNNRWRKSICFW